jgi:hypothetical protein
MFGLDAFGNVLCFIAILGTSIYTLKMLLMLVFGIGDDIIMDVDIDGFDFTADVDLGEGDFDLDTEQSNSGFTWLSINVVTSFLMLFGWFGLATYNFLHIEIVAIVIGITAGYLGVKLNNWAMFQMAKMSQSGTMNKRKLIGQQGTVYITIHPNTDGAIMIKADNGVLMEITATTKEKEVIKTGTNVKVIDVEEGKLVVNTLKEVNTA